MLDFLWYHEQSSVTDFQNFRSMKSLYLPTEEVSLFLLISFITPLADKLLEFEIASWELLGAPDLASFVRLKCHAVMIQFLPNKCINYMLDAGFANQLGRNTF